MRRVVAANEPRTAPGCSQRPPNNMLGQLHRNVRQEVGQHIVPSVPAAVGREQWTDSPFTYRCGWSKKLEGLISGRTTFTRGWADGWS